MKVSLISEGLKHGISTRRVPHCHHVAGSGAGWCERPYSFSDRFTIARSVCAASVNLLVVVVKNAS